MEREGVPELGSCTAKSPVSHGVEAGEREGEEASVWGAQWTGGSVGVQEVSKVCVHQSIEGFVGEHEQFEDDPILNWKPVEFDEGGSDVVPKFGVCEDSCSWILNMLKSVSCFGAESVENGVVVV